jgi:phosphoglycerate dehydrogenase-like enzyme
MGIVGFGRIGQATAQLAPAFGMQVLTYKPLKMAAPKSVRFLDLDIVFHESDVVSLH